MVTSELELREKLMKKMHRAIRRNLILMFGLSLCMSGLVWSGDVGDLSPRVPPDRLEEAKTYINPYSQDKAFIDQGRMLYEGRAMCVMCHGKEGSGVTIVGESTAKGFPTPTKFADGAWQAARTDGELFWILIHGSHGTDMAPFLPGYLEAKEVWQIVEYIRTFGKT